MSMNLPEYRESWWERLLFGALALVIYGPLIGITVLSGVAVAERYPPLEAPFEFVAYTLLATGLLITMLGTVVGFVLWIVSPRQD